MLTKWTCCLFLLLSIAVLPPSARPYAITKSISDTIAGGEVTYFTLQSTTPVIIVLVSSEGDADLYASPTQKNSKPSSEDHELSSSSCGLDVMAILMCPETRKYTVGIHGHIRYEKNKFVLYLIEPDEEDIRKYQVWEWDPEKKRDLLLIDTDLMLLMNDPQLNELIQSLEQSSVDESSVTRDVFEFVGFALLKLLEILIEILV